MLTAQVCPNCNNSFTEEFCNRCGQKKVHRITMGHIGHDLVHAFTHADKGILHLAGQMFIRPGIVAREYITEGKRKRYYSPFQYILVIGTIAVFIVGSSHFMENATAAINNTVGYSARQLAFTQKITALQTKYFNFMILLQLPFYALATFIMYKKKGFNFAEHLTLSTLIAAQTTIIAVFVMLSIFLLGKPGVYTVSLMGFLTAGFQIFAFAQFFDKLSFKYIFKALVTNILGLMLFTIFFIIALIIYGLATHAFTK